MVGIDDVGSQLRVEQAVWPQNATLAKLNERPAFASLQQTPGGRILAVQGLVISQGGLASSVGSQIFQG